MSGCQKPDACEWNWWPDHCQCPNAEGRRTDAPEPPEMVERNRRAARESADTRVAQVEERLRFATDRLRFASDRLRKLEAAQQETYTREQLLSDEVVDAVAFGLCEKFSRVGKWDELPDCSRDSWREAAREIFRPVLDSIDKGKGGEDG